MSGLILIGVVLFWLWAAVVIGQMLTSKLKDSWPKSLATFLTTAVLIPLPVVDEIIGGIQFRALCGVETQINYDKYKLANKTVHSQLLDAVDIESLTIPVISQTWNYRDIQSQEILLNYKTLDAEGGWLSRVIGFQSLRKPFTFDGHCGPGWTKVDEIFNRLNVTVVTK